MTARLDSVSKFICERGEWKVSNLQLQKILYIAQMLHMGKTGGQRLADTGFEAWDYGPVSPKLYRKVRMFGASPIEDVFYDAREFPQADSRRAELVRVCDQLLPLRPGALVELTHSSKGAWAKNYVPGFRGNKIPDTDIIAEYNNRFPAK